MDFRQDHTDPKNILADLSLCTDPIDLIMAAKKGIRTTLPELRQAPEQIFDLNGRSLSGLQIVFLIEDARRARESSYAPYSHFNVGSAVYAEGPHGLELFRGANVENAAYGSTMCAERTATYNAVTRGYRKIAAYAIIGDFDETVPKALRQAARQHFVTPCGSCRQVMNEFEDRPCAVVMALENGQVFMTTMNYLLPASFGPRNLGTDAAQYRRSAVGHDI